MKLGLAAGDRPAMGRLRAEIPRARCRPPRRSQSLDVLAALSQHANFSMGCYCEDEQRCHRSQLRALLLERGAQLE